MSVSSPSDLTPLKQQRFQELMRRGKELVQDGDVRGGLESMKLAAAICTTTKLLSRIKKCEEYLQAESEDEEEPTTAVAKGFHLRKEIYLKLYAYQREGIAWMWKLFQKEKGGVLGDDMGLGKTIQVIGFLSGMFDAQLIKHVLIVMPVSLLANWKNEFYQWCPAVTLCVFHGGTKKERERNLYRVQRRSGVLLTSYGIVSSNEESLTTMDDRSFVWDYVILDEGHKIKNPTKTTKAVHNISSRNRLILTGTPIQNNLEELWALYDFAHHGALLGSKRTFKMQYEAPILHARAKGSTIGERKLGTEIAENLRKLIEPYFLRRTKEEVLKEESNKENLEVTEIDEIEKRMENMRISPLSRKNDLILWTFLSEVQYKIYTGFLQSESVKRILMTKKSPLVQLTVLKKICDHPRLLSNKQGFELLLNDEISEDDINRVFDTEVGPTVSFDNITDEELIAESGKLVVLIPLLKNLCLEGHRTLLFSQSRKILDIIQRILSNNHYKVLRIDGSILKLEERYKIVQLFQNDSSYAILLLTTQVGGVGLTLTAADRVVIYDPSWNPATDAQAVDRAYRIGQSKNVVVYRLITCGTVEEKIYRRQVFKDSIIKQATGGNKDPHRYFTHQELYELFTVDNVRYSSTQVQLAELHSNERKTDTSLDEHIAFLHSLELFGISDHDLMFTKNIQDKTEDNDENVDTTDYIQKRVQLAQHMVQVEASLAQEDIRKYGSCNRFTSNSVHSGKNSSSTGSYNSTTTVRNVPSQENANNSIELIEEIGDMHDVFLSGENKLRNKDSTEVPIIQDISFQGDEIHTSVCYKPSKFVEDFCFGENADNCVKENKEFDGKSNAFNVTENKLYSLESSESPVTKERSFKRDGINLLSENISDRTVPDNNEDAYVDECESNRLNVVKAAANINKVTDMSCSPILSKIASTKEHYEKSSRNSSEQRAHLNALDSALNRKSSRTTLVHNEKSVLFRRSRGDDNSKLVASADVSAEVIVSDSDSESEMKSFAQPKIKNSFYCSPHNVSNVNPDVSFSPSLSDSVVEDSFLDVEESEIASKGVITENRSYNFYGDVKTPKQTKCENEKLLRFVALYNSLSKDSQKCISISPAVASNNTASKHYNELEKNCNFDTSKNNALSPVSKDSSDVLQLAKLPIQEELCKTPDTSYNWGITDNMISENVCSSPKRITPLKVTTNNTGGALCESPFVKALARSVEVIVTGNMHLEQRFSTEAENAELNSSENAELNSSEASDVASPIAIGRSKNCRKFINSDSEDIDSSENNSKEDFSDEDSVQSSLNDFIVSDDEEESNSSGNESSSSSDKQKKKSMLKYAYTECDESSFDSVNNESSSNENDESCESEDAEDSSETFNN